MQGSQETWPIMRKIVIKINPELTTILELAENNKTVIINIPYVSKIK